MKTLGEAIASIKRTFKSQHQEAFLTDRFIHSLLMKSAKLLIRRQDSQNKLMMFRTVFQSITMQLIEVDRVEAKCNIDIKSGCTFRRTKYKLPELYDGYWGPVIRSVTSLDGSTELTPTYRQSYEKMVKQSTFKYNHNDYYWYSDGYLYFPNIEWDYVVIEGYFVEDVSDYGCETDCKRKQDGKYTIPSGLHKEVADLVIQELGLTLQIPPDQAHDNRHIIK